MMLAMREDEFSDPPNIGLLGTNVVVFQPDGLPDLVQELHFVRQMTCGL
jgi:hypothetical protein